MNINQIKTLVAKGETEILEFKKSTAQLHAAFETMSAFLNGRGGIVLIGVTNDGKIIGQDVTDATKQEIANHIAKLEPSAQAHISVKYVLVDKKKHVIAFSVKAGKHVPYTYDSRPFQRNQTTTSRMLQHAYEQLIVEHGHLNHSWEEFIAKDYSIANLNEETIWAAIHTAVDQKRVTSLALKDKLPQILTRLNLMNGKVLLNAAVVLFGKSFLPRYPQCQLKMARFKGVNKHEFMDSDLFYGNAFELLDKAMFFVQKHLPNAAKIVSDQLHRKETSLIPFEAIREILINAICHRDYSIKSGAIGVAIYDDRLEVFNSGSLLSGITVSKMKKGGYSKARNPLIADVFYKCKLIEKWGRGVNEAIAFCKNAKVPEPEFDVDDEQVLVIFKFPHNIRSFGISIKKKSAEIELTGRQKNILEIIGKHKTLNLKQIISKLINPPSDRMVQKDLLTLKKQGFIDLTGRTRTAKWIIKV